MPRFREGDHVLVLRDTKHIRRGETGVVGTMTAGDKKNYFMVHLDLPPTRRGMYAEDDLVHVFRIGDTVEATRDGADASMVSKGDRGKIKRIEYFRTSPVYMIEFDKGEIWYLSAENVALVRELTREERHLTPLMPGDKIRLNAKANGWYGHRAVVTKAVGRYVHFELDFKQHKWPTGVAHETEVTLLSRGDAYMKAIDTEAVEPNKPLHAARELPPSPRAQALDEAKQLITGDRNNSYGPPTQDFQRSSDALTAFGYRKLGPGGETASEEDIEALARKIPNANKREIAREVYESGLVVPKKNVLPLEAHDTAIMIDTVKTSRLMWTPGKRDSWVDKAGYAACGLECAVEEGHADGHTGSSDPRGDS